MKKCWQEFPFIRIIVPFAAGILLYRAWPQIPLGLMAGLLILSPLMLWGFQQLPAYVNYKAAYLRGLCLQVMLLVSGFLLSMQHDICVSPLWYKPKLSAFPVAKLQLEEDVVEKEKTFKAEASVIALVNHHEQQQVIGRVVVYFMKSARSGQLKAGEQVLARSNFRDLKPNTNPGGFDYSRYCRDHDITQSVFVCDAEWKVLGSKANGLFANCYNIARALREILGQTIRDPSAIGIAEALLMGYRGNIDDDTWKAYSRAGIVHIIAISGMHMAMIYQSLRWLLLRIPLFRRKPGRAILPALCGMWFFASLTGLPPSVGRAAWMFSLLGIGEWLDKKSNSVNNLLVSAFILLCINPSWIADVGFQLSYLAVLSLFLFYRPVYQWVYISSRRLDLVWQLMAATIAAQVLTFPVCMYYFHQFPLLFVFSNLIAVPATTVLLYAEILLVGISWFQYPSSILGSWIAHGIKWLNAVVFQFDALPFIVYNNLQLNITQLILCYGLVLFLGFWLLQRKAAYLLASLLCMVLWMCSILEQEYVISRRRDWVVYDIPKQQAIEFHAGHNYFSPDESGLKQDTKSRTFVLEPARLYLHLNRCDSSILAYSGKPGVECFRFGDIRILRLSGSSWRCSKAISADYLVLSHRAWPGRMLRENKLKVRCIILDTTIPVWQARKIRQALSEFHIPIHSVSEQGAFVARF